VDTAIATMAATIIFLNIFLIEFSLILIDSLTLVLRHEHLEGDFLLKITHLIDVMKNVYQPPQGIPLKYFAIYQLYPAASISC